MRWRPAAPGFSLLELMAAVALVGLLASLSLPSMGGLLLRRSLQSAAEALVADLRLARTEAMRRAVTVAVCSSADGLACTGTAAWRQGWIVFVDQDGNRRRDAGEALIRVQEAPAGVASIASTAPQNDKAAFIYYPLGWSKAASQTLVFTPPGGAAPARVVCISSQGRPTLRPEGTVECS